MISTDAPLDPRLDDLPPHILDVRYAATGAEVRHTREIPIVAIDRECSPTRIVPVSTSRRTTQGLREARAVV